MEKQTAKVEAEEIIRTPSETPKMVKTVIQVIWREWWWRLEATYGQDSHTGNLAGVGVVVVVVVVVGSGLCSNQSHR